MKVGKNYFPKSSFLSTEKDYAVIMKKILGNQDLLKMLYYTQKDCRQAPDLTDAQIMSLVDTKIKLVPKLEIDESCPIYIIVSLDNFRPNVRNPEFRDCSLIFYVFCHPDHWNLGNFQLRPQKIIGELDEMFNEKKMTGIGTPHLSLSKNLVMNDQLMGMMSIYKVIHGVEDQIDPLS